MQVTVTYRNETYLVRDDGSVCRLSKPGKSSRQLDDVWTFGRMTAAGYMQISSVPVHRIVATGFHGEQPTDRHVVDHINTDRANNRSENLRWVTREENLYGNPITRERIESIWGSIDAMVRLFRDHPSRTIDSLTPGVKQRNWKTPCEFPECSGGLDELPYGSVFARNVYGESLVTKAERCKARSAVSVIANLVGNGEKPWAVALVTDDDHQVVYENKGSFFTLQGALKVHCEQVGIPLSDSIDDYC
jgi:hypothetical protein